MTAAGEAKVDVDELLAAFGKAPAEGSERYWAMARYLSGAEGWRDAGQVLCGTFSGFVAEGLTRLEEE
jgi:hypothetical protein